MQTEIRERAEQVKRPLGAGSANDKLSAGSVTPSAWRKAILETVARSLSDPRMPELQRRGALWKWNEQIPYPGLEHFDIIETGCLKFEVAVNSKAVVFSVWVMPGEVRVGVKVPNVLLATDLIRTKIGRAYDGTQCQRSEVIGDATLFDWIWRDVEFAGFDFMVSSLRDTLFADIIADRIAGIAIHLYMSTVNTLIEAHHFEVMFRRISHIPLKAIIVRAGGERKVLDWFITMRRYTIEARQDHADGSFSYTVLMPKAGVGIPVGDIRDMDGGECRVLEVGEVPATGTAGR